MSKHTIRIEVDFGVEKASYELDDDDAFAFVTRLDEVRHDWSFTLRLCDHFDKLRAEHAAEEAEDAAKRKAVAP